MQGIVTTDGDGNVIESIDYDYDVYDRRITKTVDADGDGVLEGETERYVYDGEHIALVFDGEGELTYRYLHGPVIDQVLAQEDADGNVLWALTDHQDTVRDVLNSDGTVANHISYDGFGNIISETNPEEYFRFTYTGREFDEEIEQYFYRARYYDAAIGQFTSNDPLGFSAGDSNLYRYVNNSPVNFVDPDGRRAVAPENKPSTDQSVLKGSDRTRRRLDEFDPRDPEADNNRLRENNRRRQEQPREDNSRRQIRDVEAAHEQVDELNRHREAVNTGSGGEHIQGDGKSRQRAQHSLNDLQGSNLRELEELINNMEFSGQICHDPNFIPSEGGSGFQWPDINWPDIGWPGNDSNRGTEPPPPPPIFFPIPGPGRGRFAN